MIRSAVTIAATLAISANAAARSDTDYPHRDWGQVAFLAMSVSDATACIAREMDRQGSVLVLQVEGGNDIDFSAAAMFGGSVGEPWERFKVRQEGATATLRIGYRHPVSQKAVSKDVRRMQKRCLKVRTIEPLSGVN